MGVTPEFWRGRRVFITGHTGFKGGWLALWLHAMGARVAGYALDPADAEGVFEAAAAARGLDRDIRADLADRERLATELTAFQPRVLIHMAARSLVADCLSDPVGAFADNLMGAVHALEAARRAPSLEAVLIVTTDKVYDGASAGGRFTEADRLGGGDPYGASKACAELAVRAYRESCFRDGEPRLATARAGNVIGGGDWAAGRLAPDCLRAFSAGAPARLRRPQAVRPWQHVFAPLSGSLMLVERLCGEDGQRYAEAWNFGPDAEDEVSVRALAEGLARRWGDGARVETDPQPPGFAETEALRVDSGKARRRLGWRPGWALEDALDRVVEWRRAQLDGADMRAASLAQLRAYEAVW